MARTRKQLPPIGRFGGAGLVQRSIGRSETLFQNKEVIAAELIAMGTTRITDIIDLETGQVKPIEDIPDYALASIKRITATEGGVSIELFDKVGVLRVLAKASGLLDAEKHQDKPSIVGINMKGPEPVTSYEVIEDGEEEAWSSEEGESSV
jgi:hypothetical protein